MLKLLGGVLLLLCVCSTLSVSAGDALLQCNSDGSIRIGDLGISILSKEDSGRLQTSGPETIVNPTGFVQEGNEWRFASDFRTSQGTFQLRETLREETPGNWIFTAELSAETPIRVNELALFLTLPGNRLGGKEYQFNGETHTFPDTFQKRNVLDSSWFYPLMIKSGEAIITLSGNGNLIVQDERCDNWDVFTMRSFFTPGSGMVQTAAIQMNITIKENKSQCLDMRACCNMGFADETAGDGKGGWTDQGANNDFRLFPVGRQLFNEIPYEVIDPATNAGKSCLVLSSNPTMAFPNTATLPGKMAQGAYLYLLHAAAYVGGDNQVGKVRVIYANGSIDDYAVINGMQIADWWGCAGIADGELVWKGLNANAQVGIYAVAFPLQPYAIDRIELTADSGAIWMIAGATVSNDKQDKADRTPLYIVESAQWKPITYPRDVEKGSILDFSQLNLLDAPAGKNGFVTKDQEGHFVFENRPDVPVRFDGTNLCYMANFPNKEMAETLADRIAANGYNTVRFHHYDIMFDNDAGASTELKKEMLDQLDYLFFCLKERGIYIMIDLYCTRNLSDEELPGWEHRKFQPFNGGDMGAIKALLLFTDAGFDNFKTFAKNLLTHVNPYTGLMWKDDPALSHISLINEDAVFEVANYDKEVRSLLEKEFANTGCGDLSGKERTQAFNRFLIDTYQKNYQRMAAFLKNDLGVRALLTDQNHWQSIHQAPMNAQYDFVDKHMYWSHPRFSGNGFSYETGSAIPQMGGLPLNANSAARIFGLPYAASEMNYCFPNSQRAEGGALIGAYAALQDWGAIWQFCFLANEKAMSFDHEADLFESASDPVMFLSEKLAVLFFLRGDVARSELKLPIFVPEDYSSVHDIYPAEYMKAGTFARIGAQLGNRDNTIADVTNFSAEEFQRRVNVLAEKEKGVFDLKRNYSRSTTGELEMDGEVGILKITTPRSEALVVPANQSAQSDVLKVMNSTAFAVFSVAAMDEAPLTESRRILCLHITNVLNSRMKFSDRSMGHLEELGTLPHLAAAGSAQVTLSLETGPVPQVYAVDLGGRRIRIVDSEYVDGKLTFYADVLAADQPCFVYEIVRCTLP